MKRLFLFFLLFLFMTSYVHSYTGGSGFNEGDIDMRKYSIQFNEVDSTPSCPATNYIKTYAKDSGGTTKIFTLDSACAETEIGAGTLTFLGLTDTPNNYTSSAGLCAKVNPGETAVEFGSCAASGGGDVVGPASAVDEEISRFNGTTGKVIQAYTSGGPTVSDTGTMTLNVAGTDITSGTNQHIAIMPNGTGNVGIGISTPSVKLDVVGAITASGAISGSNLSGTNTGDDDIPDAADYTNLTGGAGIVNSPTGTIATDSTEANFLTSGALTCGASTQGKAKVHTTPLQYCDNAATPALQYAAYGNSTGESTAAANDSVALTTDTTGNYAAGDAEAGNATGVACSGSCVSNAEVDDDITASNYLLLSGGTLTGSLLTDNLGIDFDDSDTNPACAAGDYKIYADLSETKLKKCINGSATDLDTTGGTLSFDTLTGGTNTTAAMVVGSGATLGASGTGTITATGVDAVGAAGITIGSVDVTALTVTTDSTGTAEVALPAGSIDSTEVLDDTLTVSDLAATLTFGATDFIDLSGTDASTTTEGLKLPQHATACAGGTAEGQVCWEADADKLWIGNGATLTEIGAGGGGDSITVDTVAVVNPDFASTGDIDFVDTSNTITANVNVNSVTLTTDTTGNYAAGDAEAGAALTGDTATAFFAAGTIEHERGGLEADLSGYSNGLFGTSGTVTIDVDTEAELETALGGLDVITVTASDITSANLITALSDETGSGVAVFGTSPTIATPSITTNATVPLVIGGSGTTQTLIFKTTTGVGAAGADHIFQVGNNGATEAMRILNNGNVGIGTSTPNGKLEIGGTGNVGIGTTAPAAVLQVVGDVVIVPKKTADPCVAGNEGGAFYNDTSNYMCYCNGTNDVKMADDTTACF